MFKITMCGRHQSGDMQFWEGSVLRVRISVEIQRVRTVSKEPNVAERLE